MKFLNNIFTKNEQHAILFLSAILILGIILFHSNIFTQQTSVSEKSLDTLIQISNTPRKININLADIETLCELPGIGPVRAQSIISYREDHGKFQSITDLIHVRGIGEKTLQKLLPRLVIIGDSLEINAFFSSQDSAQLDSKNKININTATPAELMKLPGIGTQRAQRIIDYRNQHGRFLSIDEIMYIKGIGPGLMKKIAPYLEVNNGE